MRRKHVIGLALLLGAATTVPALAQPAATQGYPSCTKTVSTNESELAHQKYIAGKQDYDEGNYESALRRFRDAYNLDCTKHDLLIIISAAYERKGDKKEALNALETYVARNPSAPDVGTYQAKIDNLKKQIAATPPPAATRTTPPASTAPGPAAETQDHTPYPWIVAGAGVAAIGIGIAVLVTAPELPTGCNTGDSTCAKTAGETDDVFKKRQEDAGKHVGQTLGGIVTIAGGGALVVGGLLWHFLEPTGPKESTAAKVRPTIAPGYAGVALGGSF
jgi:hypothetical protein